MSNESELELNQADEHHHSFDSNQSTNSRKRVILSPAHNLRGAVSKLKKHAMDEDISMSSEPRANFSALCTANSGSAKIPVNSASKPGDIKKLVIKNFKSEFNVVITDLLG